MPKLWLLWNSLFHSHQWTCFVDLTASTTGVFSVLLSPHWLYTLRQMYLTGANISFKGRLCIKTSTNKCNLTSRSLTPEINNGWKVSALLRITPLNCAPKNFVIKKEKTRYCNTWLWIGRDNLELKINTYSLCISRKGHSWSYWMWLTPSHLHGEFPMALSHGA